MYVCKNKNFFQKFEVLFIYFMIVLYSINFITKNAFLLPAKMEGDDSCIFVTIGFSWLNGLIPYRDVFEHKGPVLWIFNMWGFSFFNNELGVFVIELIFLLLWLCISLFLFRKNIYLGAFFLYILFAFLLEATFEGGNYTEEYAILFNLISVFLYFTPTRKRWLKYIAYGLMGGLCFYLRPNTAAPTVAICILECLKNFHIKNITKLVLFSLLGFIVIGLPFTLYFYWNNALYGLYKALLLENIAYTLSSAPDWYNKFGSFLYSFAPWWIILFLQLIAFLYMKKFHYLKESFFISIFTFVLAVPSLRTYPHYLMILVVPYIFTCHFFFLISKNEYFFHYQRLKNALNKCTFTKEKIFFASASLLALLWYGQYSLNLHYNMFSPAKKEAYNNYFKSIGLTSESKILNLGTHRDSSIFYYLHVLPGEKNFFPKSLQLKSEEYNIYKNIDKILSTKKYDFILMPPQINIELSKYGFSCVGKFKDSLIYKKSI